MHPGACVSDGGGTAAEILGHQLGPDSMDAMRHITDHRLEANAAQEVFFSLQALNTFRL
jgi:hypothetical protein